tara:strand:- start:60 stop:548 length:489 start_codon:yes stop_codon:yes gene_type:complete
MPDITINESDSIVVTVSETTNADSIGFTSTNDGLSSESNIGIAVNELASRFYQLSSAPTGSGINEGDLWYDLTASELKVYNGSAWVAINGTTLPNTTSSNGWLEFASPTSYTSGVLFKIKNGSNTKFEVNFDGSLNLASVSSKGTAVTGKFVFDGTDVYIGV